MPTLFRLLAILSIIAAIIYGTLFSLANFVEPTPREVTKRVKSEKLDIK